MKSIFFIFPGQGAQYPGMGKDVFQNKIMQSTIEEASDALGKDVRKLLFECSAEELRQTENAQPAIFTVSMAYFRILNEEFGLSGRSFAGHSLGEYAALCSAGYIGFKDAVRIVSHRSLLMKNEAENNSGGMSAVMGISSDAVAALCGEISTSNQILSVANYNSSDQTIVSGHLEALRKIEEKTAKMNARIVPLKVSAAFHSPLMKNAALEFEKILADYSFKMGHGDVISNVTGRPYESPDEIKTLLVEQIYKPVLWHKTVNFLLKARPELIIEAGPGVVLKTMLMKDNPGINALSFDNNDDRNKMKEVFFQTYSDLINRCLAAAVCTRNTNWNTEEYELGVVLPYREIVQLKDEGENNNPIIIDRMKSAVENLKKIFVTKGVSDDEQKARFEEIFKAAGIFNLKEAIKS